MFFFFVFFFFHLFLLLVLPPLRRHLDRAVLARLVCATMERTLPHELSGPLTTEPVWLSSWTDPHPQNDLDRCRQISR